MNKFARPSTLLFANTLTPCHGEEGVRNFVRCPCSILSARECYSTSIYVQYIIIVIICIWITVGPSSTSHGPGPHYARCCINTEQKDGPQGDYNLSIKQEMDSDVPGNNETILMIDSYTIVKLYC